MVTPFRAPTWDYLCRSFNHMDVADDLFGGPQGSPRTDKMIAAAVQWAERIMQRVDVTVGS